MWLPVTMLLLALTAGSSAAACPDQCECHQQQQAGAGAGAIFTDVTCSGRAPKLSELPAETRRLFVSGADEQEVAGLLEELEEATRSLEASPDASTGNASRGLLPCLDELALTNCSLASLNVSWLGLERMRALNLSCNDLASLSDARVNDMRNLHGLTNLDFSRNLFTDVAADSFKDLAGLIRLSLKRNAIASVHEDAFHGLDQLERLDLSDNRLSNLPDSALTSLYSLQKLDLSGNQLQVLGARLFESLDRLRELDVSRNGLARAASGALQPLPGLSVLRLAENPLKERDVSLLLGTGRRLETVDASHTGLARVPAALTRSVRTLRLAGNKLSNIRSGDLDSYPLLRTLDISDNWLTEIEDDALGRLEVLEELNISGNVLVNVPRSLPSSLTRLDLQRNAIVALRFSDMQGLYNLKSLILKDNDIAEVEEGSLSQLAVLTELDLSDNPIKTLPANTLSGPSNLAVLRMSGLSSLQRERQTQGDMTFPLPTPERLLLLDISRSPVLVGQFLVDDATLSACKSLQDLNLAAANLTTLRSDLTYKLPQLQRLGLAENDWNCTEDLYWLGDWTRQRESDDGEPARCSWPEQLAGTLLRDLPAPRDPLPTFLPTGSFADTGMARTRGVVVAGTRFVVDDIVTGSSGIPEESSVGSSEPSVGFLHFVNASGTKPAESNRGAWRESVSSKSDFSTTTTSATTTAAIANTATTTTPTTIATTATATVTTGTTTRTVVHPIYEAPTSFKNATVSVARHGQGSRDDEKIDAVSRGPSDSRRNSSRDGVTTSRGLLESPSNASSSGNRVGGREGEGVEKVNASRTRSVSPSKLTSTSSSRPEVPRERKKSLVTSRSHLGSRSNLTKGSLLLEETGSSNTIAQEFSGRATDSDARVSESLSTGTHPGMLVLTGAALGAAAALTVVLSRRATIRRRERYHRHENIEVHTLTPSMELW